jgi:non-specific protein-tyrosine kinase
MDKLKKTISSFKEKLSSKKEMTEVSLQNNPEDKDKEKSGADKMEKAILFFKQRRGSKNETPEISLENGPENNPEEKPGKTHGGTPNISLQDSPEEKEKKKAGWISPHYSQSRTVHLDPGFIAENRCLAYLDEVPETEAYRVLRSQVLQRTRGSDCNTIMVTSALQGEGKTLTAINLAFSLAREFQHTVLLVDGDLRKQSIHKYLGCAGEKGLIDYLVDGSPVPELITWPGIEKMTFISGGRPYQESAEILGSPRMKELISDMKGRYPERYILFDIPPILTAADAHTFAPLVDQIIVVVQAGKTPIDDVKKAIKFLPKEKILGFALNRC